jgi:hypothetical protein
VRSRPASDEVKKISFFSIHYSLFFVSLHPKRYVIKEYRYENDEKTPYRRAVDAAVGSGNGTGQDIVDF